MSQESPLGKCFKQAIIYQAQSSEHEKSATVAKIATVQKEGRQKIIQEIHCYSNELGADLVCANFAHTAPEVSLCWGNRP